MAHQNKGKGRRRMRKKAKLLLQAINSHHASQFKAKSRDIPLVSSVNDDNNNPTFESPAERRSTLEKPPVALVLTEPNNRAGARIGVSGVFAWLLSRRPAFTILSVGLCVLFAWLFLYFGTSTPTAVRGKLTQLGEVELTYSSFQAESVSPLCGCFKELEQDAWRGVTFAARFLQIQRTSQRPFTMHLITAPQPTNTLWFPSDWVPNQFKFRIARYTLALPRGEQFDPRWLLDKTPSTSPAIVDRREYEPESLFLLISKESMNVALLGDKPLGAWIPSDGSKLKITYEKPMLLSMPARATLEETFYRYDDDNLVNPSPGLPLGDFLGPNIVLWWVDASAVLATTKEVFPINTQQQPDKTIINALIINPPFSIRVALDSIGQHDLEEYLTFMKNKDSAERRLPAKYQDAGNVRVSILDPVGQVQDFDEIYHRMKANEITTAHDILMENESGETKHYDMSFRYPAIPPNKGFNIFGRINNLKLSSALGSILIGPHQFEINAPSTLDLRNIKSMSVEGGVMPVPVQLNPNENRTELQIQAESEVYLNGDTMNRRANEYKLTEQIPLMSLLASVLSAIAAVWSIKRSKKTV
jgi:hypothetical protein